MAIPAFGLYIPIYSFWHFDDFSWGNTRLAVGEDGAAHQVKKELEHFDPASIPLMKWSEYEQSHSGGSDGKSEGSHIPSYHGYEESVRGEGTVVGDPSSFPTDEQLLQEIRHILSTTDLMKITKKSVRERLTRLFGVDVSPKKDYIHSCIDSILKGEL